MNVRITVLNLEPRPAADDETFTYVVGNACALEYADGYFDVVISSGVIEHIGVEETSVPRYRVTPLPNRDELRAAFLRELLRVGKTIYLDCPNGAFPIDFWHSDGPGRPRFHSLREGFLPTFAEIRALVPGARVEALSPYQRLQFRQAAQHWHGRLLARPAEWYLRWMPSWLAKSALNPFLVVRIKSAVPAGSPANAAAATPRRAAPGSA